MWSWLWGRYPEREIVMYTRQGCHLCEEAWEILQRARQRFACTLRQVDVDSDPALAERYGTQVPVVAINGKVHFHGRVNAVLLHRLLRARAPREGEPAAQEPEA
jgi:glutaredoxin